MTTGYCQYHQKYLSAEEMKIKRCKCKLNTHKKCRHLVQIRTKEKYVNRTNFMGR